MSPANIEVVFEGKFLRTCVSGRWEYVERTNPSGAVVILALTPQSEVLFTEQYRVPVRQRVIEFPAGLVGDEPGDQDEGFAQAALRELIEETGWQAQSIEALMSGPTSAGLTAEWVQFVRARGLTRVGAGGGTADEDITVHAVPLDQAELWLEQQRGSGIAVDAKVYSGLWFLRQG